jgi:hypothetical protein
MEEMVNETRKHVLCADILITSFWLHEELGKNI